MSYGVNVIKWNSKAESGCSPNAAETSPVVGLKVLD